MIDWTRAVLDVQVTHRALQRGVAQEHLEGAKVRIALQQVSREAVAQRVRRHGLGDARLSRRPNQCGVDHDHLLAVTGFARSRPS
jgi:hypothetical protein